MAAQGITLGSFFKDRPSENHPEAWNELWEKHNHTPWDRSGPSLALLDVLAQKSKLFDLPTATSRKTALVPGCGRGYDVLLLASFGFDAHGLDASATAVSEARRNAEKADGLEVYKQRGERPGSVAWVESDFFAEQWPHDLGVQDGKFDLIFDYTVRIICHTYSLRRLRAQHRDRDLPLTRS
jgi:methyl halide transferase